MFLNTKNGEINSLYDTLRGRKPWGYGIMKNGAYFYIVPFQQIDKYNKIIISHFWLMDFAIDVPQLFVCTYLLLEALYFQCSKAT
jgi:hypothetical protein